MAKSYNKSQERKAVPVDEIPMPDELEADEIEEQERQLSEMCFEIWVAMQSRSLVGLQERLLQLLGVEISHQKLKRLSAEYGWRERAMQRDRVTDESITMEALETIREKAVQRRARSLDTLMQSYDSVLGHASGMIEGEAFGAHLKQNANPRELNRILQAAQRLADLYAQAIPVFHRDEGPDEEVTDTGGPVDALTLINQLRALVERPKLLELRGDTEI